MLRYKTIEIQEISDELKSILQLCKEKKIEFVLESDYGTTNKILLDEVSKTLSINITDYKNKNLIKELQKLKEKLK
jgi:hypothetical protein